jgi:hypothetical protein
LSHGSEAKEMAMGARDRNVIGFKRRSHPRNYFRGGGAAAIIAMMFLVIFSSLAAAMAIVSQGNLATADTQLKATRALAAAETGLSYIIYRLKDVTATVKTTDGLIDASNAPNLWLTTRDTLLHSLTGEAHNLQEPYLVGVGLHVGPIAVGPGAPAFTAQFTPHPIAGENYDGKYYQRPPYNTMTPAVSNTHPLDSTWVRVRVAASDGQGNAAISRGIQVDFKIEKKIRFAILSKSRVMIGRNVMIEGPIGSRFLETHLDNGHPVQMASDFHGLHPDLDGEIDALTAWLKVNDADGDNRLTIASAAETAGISDPGEHDYNGDGYLDEYDFFLHHFDTNADGKIGSIELESGVQGAAALIAANQLLELIDTFGDPARSGYHDGFIDNADRYAKVRGQVQITAALQSWQDGAAHGAYQDYFQGPIDPAHGENALTFDAQSVHEFGPGDFDVSSFRSLATGDLANQTLTQLSHADPSDPQRPKFDGSGTHREEVPYGAAYPYDYYARPVYENMTFTNVTIPKGANALFKNCKFIGVTFVETETSNTDPDFNYAGMEEADGTPKHPDRTVTIGGTEYASTKDISNNLRFDGCTFQGSIVSDAPQQFTHVRNKIAFTGRTRFDLSSLPAEQQLLYRRSTILAPHLSIEMGTFVSPSDSNETVNLSGTIVAGLIDMRGQVKVNGTILTTFQPQSDTGPVIGDTSPQFNTTLGYFSKTAGDLEAELPSNGIGVIQVRYDPTLPLPDGILGAISVTPQMATYYEVAGH